MRRVAHVARILSRQTQIRNMGGKSALEEVRAKSTNINKYLYLKQLQRHVTSCTLDWSAAAAVPRHGCHFPAKRFPDQHSVAFCDKELA